jgi:hypothetical protein
MVCVSIWMRRPLFAVSVRQHGWPAAGDNCFVGICQAQPVWACVGRVSVIILTYTISTQSEQKEFGERLTPRRPGPSVVLSGPGVPMMWHALGGGGGPSGEPNGMSHRRSAVHQVCTVTGGTRGTAPLQYYCALISSIVGGTPRHYGLVRLTEVTCGHPSWPDPTVCMLKSRSH